MSKLFLITSLALAAVQGAAPGASGASTGAGAPGAPADTATTTSGKKCVNPVGQLESINKYDSQKHGACEWEKARAVLCNSGREADPKGYVPCLWPKGKAESDFDRAQADCLACKQGGQGEEKMAPEEVKKWTAAQKKGKAIVLANPTGDKEIWDVTFGIYKNLGKTEETPTEEPSPSGNDTAPETSGDANFNLDAYFEATIQKYKSVESVSVCSYNKEVLVSSNGADESTSSNGADESTSTNTTEQSSQSRVVNIVQYDKTAFRFQLKGGVMGVVFVNKKENLALTSSSNSTRAATEEDRKTLPKVEKITKGVEEEDVKQSKPVEVKKASPECEKSMKKLQEEVLPKAQGELSEEKKKEVVKEVTSELTVKIQAKTKEVTVTSEGIKTGKASSGGEGGDAEDASEAGSATGSKGGKGGSDEDGEDGEAGSSSAGSQKTAKSGSKGGKSGKKPNSCKRRRRRSNTVAA
ncbi:hypothetical protein JDV02_000575 [Purpureocillium takamizusanense]|uniref:Uncharacterized protein n=1 Tax=Purpureocillium takamizusanense TaxID=2060973 RepID=A0A9Q8V6J0_9HYPO|nr:uncharacterized protein JDV02_000575 [Purpureocillium takamizusanense]UNI13879.1 hypothetical protein JDV02_000575 [Purpureocillium takamizusanense]